jgi:glutaconyl-CoA/methylmalonyl-CoA decarboxylase subunit gamma
MPTGAPAPRVTRARLRVADASHDVEVERRRDGAFRVTVDGEAFDVATPEARVDVVRGVAVVDGAEVPVRVEEVRAGPADGGRASQARSRVRSPMVGRLVAVRVREGAQVQRGDVLFVLEAMKMQNEVRSPSAGTVARIAAQPGETLDTERVVLEIEAAG